MIRTEGRNYLNARPIPRHRVTPLGVVRNMREQVEAAMTAADKANMALLEQAAHEAFAASADMQADRRARHIQQAVSDRMRAAVLAGEWQWPPDCDPTKRRAMEAWARGE